MKPTERLDEITKKVYKELTGAEQMKVQDDPIAELAMHFEALRRYLDEEYEKSEKK